MMDTNEAIKLLKGMQGPLQDYADMVGAPESAKGIRYVYPDPEDYAIEAAISALEEQEQHRWIPVEERLPEARKDVLVCVKTGWILVAWYGSGEKRWHISPSDVGTLHENIVAWMPLPEPYRKEEKG